MHKGGRDFFGADAPAAIDRGGAPAANAAGPYDSRNEIVGTTNMSIDAIAPACAKQGLPAWRRRPASLSHIFCDRGLSDTKSEAERRPVLVPRSQLRVTGA